MMRANVKFIVVLFLVGLLGLAWWVRVDFIQKSLPYVGHTDEPVITCLAIHILQKHDYNPHNFQYPSLPIYLTSASFAAGYFWAAFKGDAPSLAKIGSVSYPYYSYEEVVAPAKILLATLSVLTLALAGLLALQTYWRTELLILSPIVLLVSGLFLRDSWVYINVDMFGTFFGALTVWVALYGMNRSSYVIRALLPGILAGLTYACKYNFGVVLLSPLLGVWLSQQGHKIKASLIVAGSSAVGFFFAVPYSLLDHKTFIEGVLKQTRIYSTGHRGFEGQPGLAQLLHYLNHLISEYGLMLCLFALLGLVCSMVYHRKRAMVAFSFPLALLTLMSLQKVNFVRNILPLHVFFAVAAAYGWTWFRQAAVQVLTRRLLRPMIVQVSVTVLLAAAALSTIPWTRVIDNYSFPQDSRKLAMTWILKNVPRDSNVSLPAEMVLDTRPLKGKYRISRIALKKIRHMNEMGEGVIAIVPYFSSDPRFKGGEEANRLNELFAGATTLVSFGTKPVKINYRSQAATPFNPKFRIIRLPVTGG